MREVPVDEVLSPVDGDDRTETVGRDDFANGEEERRVAQDVRDLQQPPVRFGGARDLEALAGCRRDRLFEQHLVAGREKSERARPMLTFEGRVDQRRRERRSAGDVLPGAELAFGGYRVRVREPRPTLIVRLDDGDEFR